MKQDLPVRVAVVVVGGGFAGAATARFLVRHHPGPILLLEANDQPGAEASGRNAGILRRFAEDPITTEMLHHSAEWIREEGGRKGALVRQVGTWLLLGEEDRGLLRPLWERAVAQGLPVRWRDRREVENPPAPLGEAPWEYLIETPSDGVVDISALLWRYLSTARREGVLVRTSCPVLGVETTGGRVTAVQTPSGRVACDLLVNAAGAWANRIAVMAGLEPLPLTPARRHLMVTPPLPFVDRDWPVIWHLSRGWYFRPEVGGLLLSPCDAEPWEAGPAPRDNQALELLAQKMRRDCPVLAEVPIRHWWAGLRTLSGDGRFVIGFDPALEGFFWVAGLGGHGMSGSATVGRLAAALIQGESPAEMSGWVAAVHPARFRGGPRERE